MNERITMKKTIMLVVAFVWVCLGANRAFAVLTLSDAGVVGTIDSGTQSHSVPMETQWANYLLGLAANASVTADGNSPADGVTEKYATSSTDYNAVLTGGTRIDGATPNVSGFEWVLGKYDGKSAGLVLFYMPTWGGTTIPEFSYSIWGNNAEQYQLSHITGYGDRQVPEPSSLALVMVGAVMVAGAARARRLRKS